MTPTPSMLKVQEQQSSGTNGHGGATFTSGAYRQRVLNTTVRNNIGATLATNQITLPAGTYYARWRAPAFAVDAHKTRLFNITNNNLIALGSSSYALSGSTSAVSSETYSEGSAIFTLTTSNVIELDHRCETTTTSGAFGFATSFGDTEIYSELQIWKQ